MKSWPGLVAGLYFAVLVLLSIPILLLCLPKSETRNLGEFLPFAVPMALILLLVLMIAGLACLVMGFTGDKVDQYFSPLALQLAPLPFLWAVWGWVFYCYFKTRDPRALVARLMKGLLRGSILVLLVGGGPG